MIAINTTETRKRDTFIANHFVWHFCKLNQTRPQEDLTGKEKSTSMKKIKATEPTGSIFHLKRMFKLYY